MVPQGGRRASGRRSGSGSDAEHLARQSPKNVAQARRFLGLAGAADVGWIANEADPGGGGRSRARPAWRLATIHAAKGRHRETARGLQTSLGKETSR